ncbi:TonB-dependent receptor [Niabella sp.]|uniref:SusC/RagA family TonB-linked outer membrane protein n=1 Tax=Niabella sp. TaxID=1962976 RepID=UPI00262A0469|nr:TonB-dependent receptor [Niabella sp.]
MKYRFQTPLNRVLYGRHLFCLFSLCFLLNAVHAQNPQTVTGAVTDERGTALAGASISIKGTSNATVAGEGGTYRITVPGNGTLVVSSVGYASQEIPVQDRSEINVVLKSAATDLNEVVVVGYGTQLKKDLTGAVSVVKASDVLKRQSTTVAEALQGLTTGIRVRGGGQPGAEALIQIRGAKNLTGTNPLYVIDGLITDANRDFNSFDIQSIQILKDASAAAIYGSRAANGVIIITTKQGKSGPMQIQASARYTVQKMPLYDLMETPDFMKLNYQAYDNAGVPRQKLDSTVNTDWQDVAFRTGAARDLNMSFSGGGNSGSYYVSGGYFGNKGTVIGTKFDRYNLRVNTQGSKGIFSIGENLAISNANVADMQGNPVVDVYRLLPTIPVYDNTHPGGYGYGDEQKARTFGTNPLAIANIVNSGVDNFRVRGNLWSELKFTSFLKYRLNLGYETSRDHYKYLKKDGYWTLNQSYDPSIANENRASYENKLVENTLTFKEKFGKHDVSAILGQSFQKQTYAQIWGSKRNIVQDASGHYYDVLDQGDGGQLGGYRQEADLISYFGRVEYAYDNRYLINGVLRYDGTSRLGTDHKTGYFPSVSAAWRISGEKFFNVSWISDLKLRANYGTLGSSNIGYYDPFPVINTFPTIAMGRDQHVEHLGTQVKLTNPDLRWETLEQQNYGFDVSFLNNKLSLTGDYFIAKTHDVLYGAPILMTTGNDGGNPLVNALSLQNSGFEFAITYQENTDAFRYGGTLNFTAIRNKVLKLGYQGNDLFTGLTRTTVGQPLGLWYLLKTDGLFQTQDEVNNHKNSKGQVIQPNAKPGDLRFVDLNDDGQITNSDKMDMGNAWPKFETGLNLNASYKGFSLAMDWFGSFGAKVINGPRIAMDGFSDNANYRKGIQPWTPENPNTNTPRALYASTLNSRGDIDRWLESGSFARLKLISLSYDLPKEWLSRIGFTNAQLSVSGQNLITITKYTGLDPEFNNTNIYERGYDFGAYPNLKMFSVGLNFGF